MCLGLSEDAVCVYTCVYLCTLVYVHVCAHDCTLAKISLVSQGPRSKNMYHKELAGGRVLPASWDSVGPF